jgi:hypothetical protein
MAAKKKLVMVNGNQFGYSAGHYYYCKYLKDRYTITYICFDRGKEKMLLPGVQVHYIPFAGGKFKRLFGLLKTAIGLSRSIRPDVVFVVYFNLAFLVALFCRGRYALLDIRTGSLSKNTFRRKAENAVIKIQALFFHKKVILSESLLKEIRLPRKNTLVLPLGAEAFYKGAHNFTSLRLLYVGTLNNRRIYQTVQGLGIFANKFPGLAQGIRYEIIGFGSQAEIGKINSAVEQYQLGRAVTFHGELNHHQLGGFFESCNVGVAYIPMEPYYHFQPATKIFEYALSGLYTIATRTYENQRLVTPENGELCEDTALAFADALQQVHERRKAIDPAVVRSSLAGYEWKTLVEDKLEPFLVP